MLETSRGHSDGGDKPQDTVLSASQSNYQSILETSTQTQPWGGLAVQMQAAGSAWSFSEVGGDSSLACGSCAPVRSLSCQLKQAGWRQECQQEGKGAL